VINRLNDYSFPTPRCWEKKEIVAPTKEETITPPPPVTLEGAGDGDPDPYPMPEEVPSFGCLKALTILFVVSMLCQTAIKLAEAFLGRFIN
jgi:hypothetical protein